MSTQQMIVAVLVTNNKLDEQGRWNGNRKVMPKINLSHKEIEKIRK
jgi:hypothetical protein